MKAKTVIRKLAKDNFIDNDRHDKLSSLVCWGALQIGSSLKKRGLVHDWISEAIKLTKEDDLFIKQCWKNLESGGAIEKGKIYFSADDNASIEFALLISISRGYVEMTHK